MKKIGVCACYQVRNYGSMLQAFATIKTIERLGYDYELIRYTKMPTPGLVLRSLGRIPEKLRKRSQLRKKRAALRRDGLLAAAMAERERKFAEFEKTNFTRLSAQYYTYGQLRRAAGRYDAVLVGSDQLWLPQGFSTRFYNLLFVPEDILKIAYATSFGVSEIPKNKKRIARIFLNRISCIGVREQRGAELVEELTGRSVPVVLDPTLLLSGSEWKSLFSKIQEEEREPYIFCYFLGTNQEHRRAAALLRQQTGYRIVTMPHLDEYVPEDKDFGEEQVFNAGPEEFLRLVANARLVCTDSFHGTVFSILFHKRFLTFYRFSADSSGSRNSRIDSLLSRLGLMERRYQGDVFAVRREIDYTSVEERLEKLRMESMKYLTDALNRMEEGRERR